MATTNKERVMRHRERAKKVGLVRVEVTTPASKAAEIQEIARRFREEAREKPPQP